VSGVTPHAGSVTRRLVLTSLLLGLVAGAVFGAKHVVFGDRPAFVHVRWSLSVDDTARAQLERTYHLAQPELKEPRTFAYSLTNLSGENIRRLVLDPAVEDTHNIHRTQFRVGYFSPRLPYITPHPWFPAGLEALTGLFGFAALLSIGLACLGVVAPSRVRGPTLAARQAFLEPGASARAATTGIATWVLRRIPSASAEAAAAFRIVFGALLVYLTLTRPVSASMALHPSNVLSSGHDLLLQGVAAAPWIAHGLPLWIALWGTLFVVGAFTRTAFACLTLGVVGWAALYTTTTSYHTVSALLLALFALQGSRWGDAWSVDAWRRSDRATTRATPQEYGYATWAPAFVLGVAYFAAAFAKVRDVGPAWILNGTVKYHFLSDSSQAMVDWGLRVGHYPRVAVALSFGAIAVEALVVLGVLAGAYRYRLAAGIGTLCLLSGFAALQGLFWPGWWVLLLSFLPWHLVRPGAGGYPQSTTRAPARRPRLVPLLVVALVGQQVIVSLLRIEGSPVLSSYDMYSTTYASPEDYEKNAGAAYWVVGLDDAGRTHRCRITLADAEAVGREGGVVGDQRVAITGRRGGRDDVEPAGRNHRGTERNVAWIDQMDAHQCE